ncbi:MAG: hypothetical protein OXI87_12425 [Albidovulum sp.]|nr:hypothetical protein [Albidovulum sp.]
MPTEKVDGNVEQPFVDEVEQVQNASSPAVSVDKRVDRLAPVIHCGKPNQRVDRFGLVDVALSIGQIATESVLAIRRRIDDLAGCIIGQFRSRRYTHIRIRAFDLSPGFVRHGGRNRTSLLLLVFSGLCGAIAQGLFCAGSVRPEASVA